VEKNWLRIPPSAEGKKLEIPPLRDSVLRTPNRRLLDRKIVWDWSGAWHILAENHERISASRERSERLNSSQNLQSCIWSDILNLARTYFENF